MVIVQESQNLRCHKLLSIVLVFYLVQGTQEYIKPKVYQNRTNGTWLKLRSKFEFFFNENDLCRAPYFSLRGQRPLAMLRLACITLQRRPKLQAQQLAPTAPTRQWRIQILNRVKMMTQSRKRFEMHNLLTIILSSFCENSFY